MSSNVKAFQFLSGLFDGALNAEFAANVITLPCLKGFDSATASVRQYYEKYDFSQLLALIAEKEIPRQQNIKDKQFGQWLFSPSCRIVHARNKEAYEIFHKWNVPLSTLPVLPSDVFFLGDHGETNVNISSFSKQRPNSAFGFHGSPLKNWHSILRQGLFPGFDKRRSVPLLHGEGIYLAKNPSTAFMFATPGNVRTRYITQHEDMKGSYMSDSQAWKVVGCYEFDKTNIERNVEMEVDKNGPFPRASDVKVVKSGTSEHYIVRNATSIRLRALLVFRTRNVDLMIVPKRVIRDFRNAYIQKRSNARAQKSRSPTRIRVTRLLLACLLVAFLAIGVKMQNIVKTERLFPFWRT